MTKTRLEAFSDGVIAILITIMVLEIHAPKTGEIAALLPMAPQLSCYLLSFVFLGIYWSNHHHLMHAVKHVNGATLWANLHLLFWLSLVPVGTGWMGNSHFAPLAVAGYGVVLLFAALGYYILVQALLKLHGSDSTLAIALGSDFKGKISIVLYLAAIGLTFVSTFAACAVYVAVATMWLVPDRRIEKALSH